MKKFKLPLFLGVFMALGLLPVNAHDQVDFRDHDSFEGKVTFKTFATGFSEMSTDVNVFVKGTKVRVDTNNFGSQGSMIQDSKNKKQVVMILPQLKEYLVSNFSGPVSGPMSGTVTKTGKTDIILGHRVEEWTIKKENSMVSFWFASGMGLFFFTPEDVIFPSMPEDQKRAVRNGLFPLKIKYVDLTFPQGINFVATELKEKKLEDEDFEPPRGFTKLNAPDLLNTVGSQSIGVTLNSQGQLQ